MHDQRESGARIIPVKWKGTPFLLYQDFVLEMQLWL
jgi:hypothetical protein